MAQGDKNGSCGNKPKRDGSGGGFGNAGQGSGGGNRRSDSNFMGGNRRSGLGRGLRKGRGGGRR